MSASAIIVILLVLAVTVLGFFAANWRRTGALDHMHEWALGGRNFGTIISWFLIGGDLYTAYTFIAVPALAYGAGPIAFFALPYTIVAYPFGILVLSRFWSVSRNRGYITAADFVRDRFGDRWLEIVVAITGVVAILPYIALQLVGMQVVFQQLGGFFAVGDGKIALAIAFLFLAAYTYTSGLRAPALIALIKDTLIYITIICAIVAVTHMLGGWSGIFSAAQSALAAKPKPATLLLPHGAYFVYGTLAFGSALALFIYPHSITSILSAKSRHVVERNMALLPIYSLLLGFLALLGYAGLAAGIKASNAQFVVPMLFAKIFPDWFAGVGYAAIIIGALVPAAIMAIGGANLFASNIFQEFSATRHPGQTSIAKMVTLAICIVALLFVVFIKPQYAIGFQFLGGAWILQTFPAFVIGLYTNWFNPKALLLGWIAGVGTGTYMAVQTNYTAAFPLHLGGATPLVGYGPFYALLLNLVVTAVATPVFNAFAGARGTDATSTADYA
ncbi:MAG TPA: sodium:solute symporter [Candidatus Acidoferrales bacterium]|nr:sodium:solute symporter [Candidatus Acidoferrales bacterium]